MQGLAAGNDTESDHSAADRLLITFLRTNGYRSIADAYASIPKWFA